MVQQQTVGRHPVADLSDACCQSTGTRCSIVTPTCQVQLRVVGVEVNVDVVFGGDVGQFCCVQMNSRGPNTKPCGTPWATAWKSDCSSRRRTDYVRPQRYVLSQASARSEIPNVHRSLSSSMTWSTLSNAAPSYRVVREPQRCQSRDLELGPNTP